MNTELTISQDKKNNLDIDLKKAQESFLSSSLGKIINNAIDIGLRSVLPDLIEDEIINIKDTILENGFSEGIKKAVTSAINFGKSAAGIITGQFENTSQIEMAIKKGGIIDSVSDLLDFTLKKAKEKDLIDNSVVSIIKNGKNTILNTVAERIEKNLETQVKSLEKLENYCNIWKEYYNKEDFENMEKAYKNIKKYLEKTVPLENTLIQARKIENLHSLIKNNGKQFNISNEEKRLAEILVK